MNIINNTTEVLTFKYGSDTISIEPGEIFPFNGFESSKLKDIQKLLKLGFVTFYDDEDNEEIIPYDLIKNKNNSKKLIVTENQNVFSNVDFDKVNLE